MNSPGSVPRPVPHPDARSQPFFDAAERGELLLQHCPDCGRWAWPVATRCPSCFGGHLAWRGASGLGTLYSYVVVHQLVDPGLADEIPYNVALVDLDEGVRVVSNVVGLADEDLRIGQRLTVTFEPSGDTVIPKFRPGEPLAV